jgi:hypothetical protein
MCEVTLARTWGRTSCTAHVRYWPKADISSCNARVRFRGWSGHESLHCICLLLTQADIILTQSGHTFEAVIETKFTVHKHQ